MLRRVTNLTLFVLFESVKYFPNHSHRRFFTDQLQIGAGVALRVLKRPISAKFAADVIKSKTEQIYLVRLVFRYCLQQHIWKQTQNVIQFSCKVFRHEHS